MRFQLAVKIGSRWSRFSRYSLRDICVCIVDKYSLTDQELDVLVGLLSGSTFTNDDLKIKRVK